MNYLAPALNVRNLAESLRFYREVLGFDLWFQWGPEPEVYTTAGVSRGNVRFILDQEENPAPAAPAVRGEGITLYIDVGDNDIDAYWEQVRQQARVLSPIADKPWGDRVFTVADPDGYRISFARTNG